MQALVDKFRPIAFTCSFLGQANSQIDANKVAAAHATDLLTLAKFQYLLPRDLILEWQDRPANVHAEAAPKILVFEFIKRGAVTHALIEKRISRFEAALQRFLSRRDLDDLDTLAKVPENPNEVHTKLEPGTTIIDRLESLASASRTTEARVAQYNTNPIDPEIAKVMAQRNIEKLYSHQYEGIALLNAGYNLIVSTATASGKTFIFQGPTLAALEKDKDATALFIYPTKALAQDQLQIFRASTGISCDAFDGDTELEKRDQLKQGTQVIFTNPDILHYTLLPDWSSWQDFLAELRFVVIDEVHSYRGLFGAHVALILRRLRRLCATLGNDSVQFICCSATIERPILFMHQLTGIDTERIKLVENDGSPSAKKHYYFVDTKPKDPKDLKEPTETQNEHSLGPTNPIHASAAIVAQLATAGYKTIAFCKYRRECELLMKAIRAQPMANSIIGNIMSYRGGYSKQDRRKIESDMFNNKLKVIVATSALEVGIDIGSLDAVVLCGFPSSLSSLRQQIGRVGRRDRDSIVVYVAGGHLQDQTYLNNPDWLFKAKDPDVPLSLFPSVIEAHVQCAARELALTYPDDLDFFNFEDIDMETEILPKLEEDEWLYHCSQKWLPYPTKRVNIRHIEEQSTAIVDVTDKRNIMLETIESFRVGFTAYPGAIYIYQGLPYLVIDLQEDLLYAKVVRTNVSWTTRQRDYTDVDPVESYGHENVTPDTPCHYGKIHIKTVVFGYFKVDKHNRIIDAHDVTLPPVERMSSGLWINIPPRILSTLHSKKLHAAAAIHAAEHIFMKSILRSVAASAGDMGTECKAPEKEFAKTLSTRQRPARLIFYQRESGSDSTSVWYQIHAKVGEIIETALQTLDQCRCEAGCAKCVGLPTCSEKNIVLSKRGAQVIYRMIKGRPTDDIRDGPEEHLLEAMHGTVVPVSTA